MTPFHVTVSVRYFLYILFFSSKYFIVTIWYLLVLVFLFLLLAFVFRFYTWSLFLMSPLHLIVFFATSRSKFFSLPSATLRYTMLSLYAELSYNACGYFSSRLSSAVASITVHYKFHYYYSCTRVVLTSHSRWCRSGISVCQITVYLLSQLLSLIRHC